MKRYIMAGLLVWVPLGITIWVILWLGRYTRPDLLLVPEALRPKRCSASTFPGLGVVLSFAICSYRRHRRNFFGSD
jgi:uncharacterized membrane protein